LCSWIYIQYFLSLHTLFGFGFGFMITCGVPIFWANNQFIVLWWCYLFSCALKCLKFKLWLVILHFYLSKWVFFVQNKLLSGLEYMLVVINLAVQDWDLTIHMLETVFSTDGVKADIFFFCFLKNAYWKKKKKSLRLF